MRKLLPLFLLLWCSASFAATRTFTDAGDYKWSTSANWDTPPASGDSVQVASGTCSTDVAIHVKSINVAGSSNFSFGNKSDTVDNVFRWGSSGIWRHSAGSALVVTGDGGIFSAAGGTRTTSTGAWILHGNDSISITGVSIGLVNLDVCDSGKTVIFRTYTTNVGLFLLPQATNSWKFHGGTWISQGGATNTDILGITAASYPGSLLSIAPGTSITHTGTGTRPNNFGITCGNSSLSSRIFTLPEFTATTTGFLFRQAGNTAKDTLDLAGNLNITGALSFGNSNNQNTVHRTQNYSVTTGNQFSFGTTGTGLATVWFGSSAVACSTIIKPAAKNDTFNFQTSQWSIKQAFNYSDSSGITSWLEGGKVTFVNGGTSKTLASKGHAFQDVEINCPTAQTLTLQDSLQADTLTLTSGKFKSNAYNVRLTGSLLSNSSVSTDTMIINSQLTFVNAAKLKLTWKGITGALTSMTVQALENLDIWLDSHKRSVSRMVYTSGKTITQHAHDTLAIQNWTSGNWSGSIWRSDTAGVYTYDSLPTTTTPTAMNVKDHWNIGAACTPDTTSQNWGHNYGFVWPAPRADSLNKDTIYTSGGDTVRVRGKYFGRDALVKIRFGTLEATSYLTRSDSIAIVIAPAGSAGATAVYIVTSDTGYLPANRDTLSVVYKSACTYDTMAYMYGTTRRQSYALSVPCSTLAKMTCDSVKAYLQIRSLTNMTWQTRDSTVWTKTVLKDTLRATYLAPDKAYYLRLRSIAKLNAWVDTLSTRSARTRPAQ